LVVPGMQSTAGEKAGKVQLHRNYQRKNNCFKKIVIFLAAQAMFGFLPVLRLFSDRLVR